MDVWVVVRVAVCVLVTVAVSVCNCVEVSGTVWVDRSVVVAVTVEEFAVDGMATPTSTEARQKPRTTARTTVAIDDIPRTTPHGQLIPLWASGTYPKSITTSRRLGDLPTSRTRIRWRYQEKRVETCWENERLGINWFGEHHPGIRHP